MANQLRWGPLLPDVIEGIRFRAFQEGGASRPFNIEDSQGSIWVAKALWDTSSCGALLSELVCGSLAAFIGLPAPRVAICRLREDVVVELQSRGLPLWSNLCIAGRFYENLGRVPRCPQYGDKRANPLHLTQFFSEPQRQAAFYGKSLFDFWVGMNDTKYDQVYVTKEGTPLFLDFGCTLLSSLHSDLTYIVCQIRGHNLALDSVMAPYLQGVLSEPDLFLPWLKKLGGFSWEAFNSLTSIIPEELMPKPEAWKCAQELLVERKDRFVAKGLEDLKCEYWREQYVRGLHLA